ncbi:MAG: UDP-glucose 4-epimerase GalE [Bacteroidia bacterium]
MSILITGGCGYIGSHTLISLLEGGNDQVISIDNYLNSSAQTIDRIEQVTGKRVLNYAIDLCDEKALNEVFDKHSDITGIIHFAALKAVGDSVEKPLFYYRNNMQGLINLLQQCQNRHIKNFIFSSSCTVYGEIDPSYLPVKENTPLQPANSPYGWTKHMGEQIMQDFLATAPEDFQGIALRYFNPVGAHPTGLIGELPNGRPSNLVPFITQSAAGILPPLAVFGDDYPTRDGTCIRDYIHVSDIAEAHVLALSYLMAGKQDGKFDVYNLGSGNGVTVLEAIQAFERASGRKLEYNIAPRRSGDVSAIYSDSSKAAEQLGWIPKFGIDDMMASAWKWQQGLVESQSA